jgi:hypothetical protein
MTIWRRRESRPSPEATAARKRAEEALAKSQSETPFFRALAASVRDVTRTNHLAEAFEHTLGVKR